MFSEYHWDETMLLSLLFLVIFIFSLVGFLCYQIVNSFIETKTIENSLLGNILLKYMSVTSQIRIPICCSKILLLDILKFENPLYECVSRRLNGFLYVISVMLVLAIGVTGYIENLKPNFYLNLSNEVGTLSMAIIGVTAVLLHVIDIVGWCNSWNICAKEPCLSPFLPILVNFMLLMIIFMMFGLMIKSIRSCINVLTCHNVRFPCLNLSQVGPANSNEDLEISTVSGSVHEELSNDVHERKVVSPGIHLLTFLVAAIESMVVAMVCSSLSDNFCSKIGISFIVSLAIIVIMPVIWITARAELRCYAFRTVREWIGID